MDHKIMSADSNHLFASVVHMEAIKVLKELKVPETVLLRRDINSIILKRLQEAQPNAAEVAMELFVETSVEINKVFEKLNVQVTEMEKFTACLVENIQKRCVHQQQDVLKLTVNIRKLKRKIFKKYKKSVQQVGCIFEKLEKNQNSDDAECGKSSDSKSRNVTSCNVESSNAKSNDANSNNANSNIAKSNGSKSTDPKQQDMEPIVLTTDTAAGTAETDVSNTEDSLQLFVGDVAFKTVFKNGQGEKSGGCILIRFASSYTQNHKLLLKLLEMNNARILTEQDECLTPIPTYPPIFPKAGVKFFNTFDEV